MPLGPINVLIGPNGSGKSNFIGVFPFLNAINSEHLRHSFDSTSSDEVELPSLPEAPQLENDIKNPLDSWRLYHFHDTSSGSSMKKTADLNDNRFFRPDGANLAPFLYYLREKHESSYSLIRRTVQRGRPAPEESE